MDEDALLAQALWAAERADLYGMGGYGSDGGADSDSDYGSSKRRKKGKAGAKPRSRKPPAAPKPAAARSRNKAAAGDTLIAGAAAAGSDAVAQQEQEQQQEQQGLSVGGRRKRKDSGQKREKGKAWSEVEEAAFLSGLEAHGRNWKATAAVIGSRDARQVASHAQKHFIRLCMTGTPLPARVLESGAGYTLSGNLLDPHSASAAAYGFSYTQLLERLEGEQLATALSGLMPVDGQEGVGVAEGDTAAAAAGEGGGAAGGQQDSGAARDQQQQQGAIAACPAPKRQRRGNSNSSSKAAAVPLPPPQQQQQQVAGAGAEDGDTVAAILAAAPLPPLAASELAAKAVAAAEAAEAAALAAAAAAAAAAVAAAEEAEAVAAAAAAAGGACPAEAAAGDAGSSGDTSSKASLQPPSEHQQLLLQDAADAAAVAAAAQAAAASALTAEAPATTTTPAAAAMIAGPSTTTEYARSRPRREAAGRHRVSTVATQLGSTSESLELVVPHEFTGGPVGSGAAGAQPYSVEVNLQAMLIMEVHVHLSGCEVIGLLGGTWDKARRLLTVTDAYPCRRAAGTVDATSVELDAAAEVEARGAMAAAGQRCVGWYHSHPVFEARPSVKDMDNQRNYQALTRDTSTSSSGGGAGGSSSDGTAAAAGCSGGSSCGAGAGLTSHASSSGGVLEPFVGFILSPFDPALPLPHTSVKAFVVQQSSAAGGVGAVGGPCTNLVPYNVRYGLINSSSLPGAVGAGDGDATTTAAAGQGAGSFSQQLQALLTSCKYDMGRTNFNAPWRPFSVLDAASGVLRGPCMTKLDKLLAGLRWQCGHVADREAVEHSLIQGLCAQIQECWEVQLRLLQKDGDAAQQQQQPDEQQPGQQQLHEQQQEQEHQQAAATDCVPQQQQQQVPDDDAGADRQDTVMHDQQQQQQQHDDDADLHAGASNLQQHQQSPEAEVERQPDAEVQRPAAEAHQCEAASAAVQA